jgi:hypothetical protein
MVRGPQIGFEEPFFVISAVTPEPQAGLDIRTLPRTLTRPAAGDVHDRATHDERRAGGNSSKLLTKPERLPPAVHF